jgi:hypothetical protein
MQRLNELDKHFLPSKEERDIIGKLFCIMVSPVNEKFVEALQQFKEKEES